MVKVAQEKGGTGMIRNEQVQEKIEGNGQCISYRET